MKRKIAICIILAFALSLSPIIAVAGTSDSILRASDYLQSYSASIIPGSNGALDISFTVRGTSTMDELGATMIVLREKDGSSWKVVKTFLYTDSRYSNMLSSNRATYSSFVSYSGQSGKSYYAVVTFWAGKDGGGDTKSYTTSEVTAK